MLCGILPKKLIIFTLSRVLIYELQYWAVGRDREGGRQDSQRALKGGTDPANCINHSIKKSTYKPLGIPCLQTQPTCPQTSQVFAYLTYAPSHSVAGSLLVFQMVVMRVSFGQTANEHPQNAGSNLQAWETTSVSTCGTQTHGRIESRHRSLKILP